MEIAHHYSMLSRPVCRTLLLLLMLIGSVFNISSEIHLLPQFYETAENCLFEGITQSRTSYDDEMTSVL